jgi:formate dehydrogenase subunit delta
MDIDNLVHMANQIGDFFSAFPDREEAMMGIATHIHKFWEPRMRVMILDGVATNSLPELMPLVSQSLQKHGDALRPKLAAGLNT